jgi:hypothetical protein
LPSREVSGSRIHPPRSKILPLRIFLFNQIDLPLPAAVLDLLLERDGGEDVLALHAPHKPGHVVSAGEARHPVAAVLIQTLLQVAGHGWIPRLRFAPRRMTGLVVVATREVAGLPHSCHLRSKARSTVAGKFAPGHSGVRS